MPKFLCQFQFSALNFSLRTRKKPVKTLDDLRKALLSGACDQFLTVKTEDNVFVVFPMARVLEEEERFAIDYRYPLSPTIQQMLGMTAMPKK